MITIVALIEDEGLLERAYPVSIWRLLILCVYSIRSSKSAERIVDGLFTIKFAGHGYDSTTRFSDTTCSVHVVSSVTYMYTVTDRQTQWHVRTSSVACTYILRYMYYTLYS